MCRTELRVRRPSDWLALGGPSPAAPVPTPAVAIVVTTEAAPGKTRPVAAFGLAARWTCRGIG